MELGEQLQAAWDRDVRVVNQGERTFYIIGTAHVSQESADLVEHAITTQHPDTVCIELDEKRHKALAEQNKWDSLNIREVIREKRLAVLVLNLLLSSYQKKLGKTLGVTPGHELLTASQCAEKHGIPIALCDRDVRITLKRAWHSMKLFEKAKMLASGISSVFQEYEITEDDLSKLRDQDTMTELMQEMSERMPALKRVLLDERDGYLAQKIMDAPGKTVVAVVGAGHAAGIVERIETNTPTELGPIEEIPPSSPWFKIIGWGIPALIIAGVSYIGITQGPAAAGENAWFWALANIIPAGIGATLALAHPLTILAGALSAPLTSLTPVVGAGYVAAFVQAYFRPPTVKELHDVSDDAGQPKMWWRNRLLRILLVAVGTGLGSVIGTYVGAYEIFQNLS